MGFENTLLTGVFRGETQKRSTKSCFVLVFVPEGSSAGRSSTLREAGRFWVKLVVGQAEAEEGVQGDAPQEADATMPGSVPAEENEALAMLSPV
eukprot:6384373-Amphidinium_carterae.2